MKYKELMNLENNDFFSNKTIYPVFQPIFSLKSSLLIGYESYIRFDIEKESKENLEFLPKNIFEYEKQNNELWAFDKKCFKISVKIARSIGLNKKIFINVNSNSFFEKDFQKEYFIKTLQKYGIESSKVVLEIPETVLDKIEPKEQENFKFTINYFKQNGIQIALDNFGSTNFNLKKIYIINPNYVKLDISITKEIEKDEIKQKLVKSLVSFCKSIGTYIIATGIETENQLKKILELNVDFAEGFFIAKPKRLFDDANKIAYSTVNSFLYNSKILEKSENKNIKNAKIQNANKINKKSAYPENRGELKIGDFCVPGITFVSETLVSEVLQNFQINKDCLLAVVLDLDKHIIGTISRSKLLSLFSSQYGFTLYSKKSISHLMEKDFLSVDENETLIDVSEKAMLRNEETIYSPIVVKSKDCYKGIVTIKRLLDTIVNVEVAEKTKDLMLKNKILTKQQQIQMRDMKMAELVQKSFYKAKAPSSEEWDCAFYFKPMASVSGDVYDFYTNKKNGKFLGCSLFDVSGHGVASGLVGILSKYLAGQAFKSYSEKKLEEMLKSFNKALTEAKGMVENYLTGVFIRTNENKIEYVNAGHPDVLIKKSDEKVQCLGKNNKNFRGSFIGIEGLPSDFKTVYEEVTHNSYLLLYTDCLTESRNLMGFELEQPILKKLFEKACNPEKLENSEVFPTAKQVLNSILEAFELFTEGVPLKDDLTVIVLKYK